MFAETSQLAKMMVQQADKSRQINSEALQVGKGEREAQNRAKALQIPIKRSKPQRPLERWEAELVSLRKAGMTYGNILKTFNEQGITTKTGKALNTNRLMSTMSAIQKRLGTRALDAAIRGEGAVQ